MMPLEGAPYPPKEVSVRCYFSSRLLHTPPSQTGLTWEENPEPQPFLPLGSTSPSLPTEGNWKGQQLVASSLPGPPCQLHSAINTNAEFTILSEFCKDKATNFPP